MLNLWKKAVFLGFLFTCIVSMIDFSGKCDGVNDKILRLHVLANSDSKEDQELKLKVRDRVLLYCSQYMEDMTKRDIVKKIISDHKEDIKKEARDEILKNGYNYDVDIEIADDVYFNTRNYNTVTIPAGNYEAVRVLIGEGKGKNWWCVMFPPLCFVDEQKGIIDKDTDDKLREVLTEEEYELISQKTSKQVDRVQIKFKIVEIIQDIIK